MTKDEIIEQLKIFLKACSQDDETALVEVETLEQAIALITQLAKENQYMRTERQNDAGLIAKLIDEAGELAKEVEGLKADLKDSAEYGVNEYSARIKADGIVIELRHQLAIITAERDGLMEKLKAKV